MKKTLSKFVAMMFIYAVVLPSANAGILSQNLCRPYKRVVDNELFLVVGFIVTGILIIGWKLAPKGTILQRAIEILAAIGLGLNLENLMQMGFGSGFAC